MKPGKRVLLFVLACGVAAGMIALVSGDNEPVYQGKPLKQWMNLYLWPDDPTASELFRSRVRGLPNSFYEGRYVRQSEAGEAVRHIGTNAIPTLLKWEDKDAQVAWKLKVRTKLPKRFQEWHLVGWWLM